MNVVMNMEWSTDAEKQIRKLGGSVRGVHKEVMKATALYWHHQIFPGHFTPGNESRYDMEKRTPKYIENTKRRFGVGQGRYVSNVFTGMSRRWMLFANVDEMISGTSMTATVKMKAPTYFTQPAIGDFTDKNGRKFTIKRQPDKPAEVTQVNEDDIAQLQKYMNRTYQSLLDKALAAAMGQSPEAKAA